MSYGQSLTCVWLWIYGAYPGKNRWLSWNIVKYIYIHHNIMESIEFTRYPILHDYIWFSLELMLLAV